MPYRCSSGVCGAGLPEVAVEVLFAGEIGAPRREAHRAVVDRAQDRPVGSALVISLGRRRCAGPPMRIGVCPVMRRAYRDGRTTCHSPYLSCADFVVTTPRRAAPCSGDLDDRHAVRVIDLLVFSWSQLAMPSGNSSTSSVYSLFWTSSPCDEPSIVK